MTRAFLVILDSLGIGGAPDAASFGDEGANTLCHIADHATLRLPHLASLGLGLASEGATGRNPLPGGAVLGSYAHAVEVSRGKDTITGHWEIAGVPLTRDWGYFPRTVPAFPQGFMDALIAGARLPGLLAMKHAEGLGVIEAYGAEHIATGKPIIYTSADSVIQIAAHEKRFGLARLYDVCAAARGLAFPLNIGRVIARPFLGDHAGAFHRTGNRRDYSVRPPSPTLLDVLTNAGRAVASIGKIGDIFAHSGTGTEVKASGHPALMDALLASMDATPDGGFAMVNFVDFDTLYGHRRDPAGYGRALEAFDAMLPRVLAKLGAGDLLVLTADHGNDPTWTGTDHTREQTPVLAYMRDVPPRALGQRSGFADTGQTIAAHLRAGPLANGVSWL